MGYVLLNADRIQSAKLEEKMFGQSDNDVFEMTDALDALGDLEQNTSDAIIAQRTSKRIDIHIRVIVRPGNASERKRFVIQGMTSDLSNGGTKVILPCPILPGDIFWLEFGNEQVKIGSLLARCRRCIMIKDDAFEVGLRFFEDVDLANSLVADGAAAEPFTNRG